MGTISHPASTTLGSGSGHRSHYNHIITRNTGAYTLELLILCQRKKVMIWSCVSQMVEHGDIIEEFPAFSVHRAKHMHIHVAISGLDKI